MSKVYTHFANVLWSAKLLTGPTSASPGPTLLSVAATALMDVTMSCPLRLTASAEAPHIMKYMAMKLAAEVTIEVEDHYWFVEAPWLEHLLACTNLNDFESRNWLDKQLRESGLFDKMEAMGVQDGDTVIMYDLEFEYQR